MVTGENVYSGKALSATLKKRGQSHLLEVVIHLPRRYRFRRWLFKSLLALAAVYYESDVRFIDEARSCE